MNIQRENSARYFRVQSEREQTLDTNDPSPPGSTVTIIPKETNDPCLPDYILGIILPRDSDPLPGSTLRVIRDNDPYLSHSTLRTVIPRDK